VTLKDVPRNLITDEVVESLVSTVASFGPLGVTHCDLNVANILFVPGPNGIQRSVIIDFGSSFTHEDESEDKWKRIVEQEQDIHWLKVRLRDKLGQESNL
jgi:RIO-like serine/threonine protein kinase